MGACLLPSDARVTFRSWNPESQFGNSKVACSNGWMSVEGLPLNMWNIHVFKVIGEKCGGLSDVDSSTAEKKFLPHARLQFKGLKGGFLLELLIIYCWGKETKLRIF